MTVALRHEQLPWLAITVLGIPKPKGSLRHVGKGRMVEQLAGSPVWREAVKTAAWTAAREANWVRLENVPVAVTVELWFDRPASAPKRRITWPITRSSGDIDKQARNLLDALVDAGIMKDDSQVIDLRISKRYTCADGNSPTIPGATIRVTTIGGAA